MLIADKRKRRVKGTYKAFLFGDAAVLTGLGACGVIRRYVHRPILV